MYEESIKSAILSTDMDCHFTLLEDTAALADTLSEIGNVTTLSELDRQLIINSLVHASDISNPCREWNLSKKWSDLVLVEFFAQGDLEIKMELPATPNMDRNETNQSQFSISFHDYIVRPFFVTMMKIFPKMSPLIDCLSVNREKWYQIEMKNYVLKCGTSGSEEKLRRDSDTSSYVKDSDPRMDNVMTNTSDMDLSPIDGRFPSARHSESESSSKNSKKSSIDNKYIQGQEDHLRDRDSVSNQSLEDGFAIDYGHTSRSTSYVHTTNTPKFQRPTFSSSPRPGYTPAGGRRLSIAAGVVVIPDNYIAAWDSSNDGLQIQSIKKTNRASSFNNQSNNSTGDLLKEDNKSHISKSSGKQHNNGV